MRIISTISYDPRNQIRCSDRHKYAFNQVTSLHSISVESVEIGSIFGYNSVYCEIN